MGAASCGRLGFDGVGSEVADGDGGVGPLGPVSAEPNEGGLEGEIAIRWDKLDTSGAVRLDLRRAAGDRAPADCDSGQLALSITDHSKTIGIDRVPDRWNRTHSYRACLYNAADTAFTDAEMVVEGTRYYNPEPHCSHPPCTNINSTRATTGTFTRGGATLTPTGSSGGDLLLADVNNDDNLDVIVATDSENLVHFGVGDGTFTTSAAFSARTEETVAAVVADFDNDGRRDVVFANRTGPSYIHLGTGDGSFDDGTPISNDIYPELHDIAAADINGDTFLDLFIARFGERDAIFLGDGSGGFTFSRFYKNDLDETCVNCVLFQDMNRDDVPDLVIAYNTGNTRVEVALGKGDGTFSTPFSIPFGTLTPIAVKVADLNGDKNPDLVVGRSLGGAIYVSLGDGTGTFSDLVALATETSSRVYGLGVTDFDGDGAVDIAFSQDNNGVIGLLPGNGDGTFDVQRAILPLTFTTTSIDIGDIDRDGKIDFAVGIADGSEYFLGF